MTIPRKVIAALVATGVAACSRSGGGSEPTAASEFRRATLERVLSPSERALDARRKATMSPPEAAWEEQLEASLGDYYLPGYKREKFLGRRTAWDYVPDDPTRPNVLIIGDSISRGYTLAVRDALQGEADVFRAPENCGSTDSALRKLDRWLAVAHPLDVIVFNFGIHDRGVSAEVYRTNLERVVERLRATGAKLVWVSTTPLPPWPKSLAGWASPAALKAMVTFHRGLTSERLNQLARGVMAERGVSVVDLEQELGAELRANQRPNDVHFPEAFYVEIGRPVAKGVRAALRP